MLLRTLNLYCVPWSSGSHLLVLSLVLPEHHSSPQCMGLSPMGEISIDRSCVRPLDMYADSFSRSTQPSAQGEGALEPTIDAAT
jgi:hypothetical protein